MALFIIGCSTSNDLTIGLEDLETYAINSEETFGANPFEQIGPFYQRMRTTYNLQNNMKLKDIYNQLNQTLLAYNIEVKGSNNDSMPNEIPSYFLADETTLLSMIENSALNETAKTSLYEFMQDLLNYNGDNYDFVLAQVYKYESETINNKYLTSYDRQVILTFTTLVKNSDVLYSDFTEKAEDDDDELEDQDWDLSVGHLVHFYDIADSETIQEMVQAMYESFKGL